ncbi:MAG: glycohydrolase toxin TNT-related protein [Clostridia bacterium]
MHDVVDSMSSLSKIALTFGQIGGGVQFELPNNVSCLIKNGFLKEIFW